MVVYVNSSSPRTLILRLLSLPEIRGGGQLVDNIWDFWCRISLCDPAISNRNIIKLGCSIGFRRGMHKNDVANVRFWAA